MKLIVTGSIAFDYLMSFPGKFSDHFLTDKLDSISVSFLVDSLNKRKGGCAANIAYNLSLLGESPLLVGTAGKDFGEYRAALEKAGVDTSGVKIINEEYTASFFANSDQDGNQIASFYPGAMKFAKDISLKELELDSETLVIISPNDPEAMVRYTKECQGMHIPFIYDPGQQIVVLKRDVLREGIRGAKVFILNDYEFEMFRKKTNLELEKILEFSEIVIITRGRNGSIIHTRKSTIEIPVVPPLRVLDPTGVGDAYRAGFVKGLIHGFSLEIAGRMGSLAATYVLETEGPQSHSYDLKEFVERYCHVFGKSEEGGKLLKTKLL